jgi:acyl-coenzyme A thioesterase PaaI-like protein
VTMPRTPGAQPTGTGAASEVTPEEFARVACEGMPSASAMKFEVEALDRGAVTLRMNTGPSDLRPGETIAGPVLFGFADLTVWALVMSVRGAVPLAVTTNATIHFLRRPAAGVLVARGRLLREGKRLVVGEVEIHREGDPGGPVAHAVMTYSVPPTTKS